MTTDRADNRRGADRHGVSVLVRTELRARARHILNEPVRAIAVVIAVVMFGLVFPLFLTGEATGLGRALAAESAPIGTIGAVASSLFALGSYVGGATAIQQNRLGSVGPLVRTSISPRAVVAGRSLAEVVQAVAMFVPTGLTLLVLVAIGARGVVEPFLVLLAVAPVLLASLALGRFGGAVVRLVGRRIHVSPWLKVGAAIVVMAAVFVAFQTGAETVFEDTGGAIPALLPGRPVQAYANLAIAPLGGQASLAGGLVLTGLAVGTAVGVLGAFRVERHLLVVDDDSETTDTGSRAIPRLFTATRSTRIAWRYLLRTWRDPKRLAHLTPLLFGGLSFVGSFVANPESVRTIGPAAAIVTGGVLAGATFGMNPLGDERDQLSLLLTSTGTTAPLLRGRAIAGSMVGLAIAVGGAVPLQLWTGSVTTAIANALFAVAFVAAGAGTALGFGALAPRFEQREYMNVDRAHPSTLAVMFYGGGGIFVGALGLALLDWALGDAAVSHLVFLALYLLVVLGIALAGYVGAVRRFDGLTLDEV
ncbi:hypothetical protein VB773_04610 [Haloarculaceae archaeon H-GB2-1]|nr:hypothetical protein [Haloarculaceae archaeon H-GB1-1]MEA5388881.1 hypothetical protein [Haloarculaceae archaeon H-GB11]MEA5406933.1 hypothetical protein [Haloarculaceae archaeon H-GB2-1]